MKVKYKTYNYFLKYLNDRESVSTDKRGGKPIYLLGMIMTSLMGTGSIRVPCNPLIWMLTVGILKFHHATNLT